MRRPARRLLNLLTATSLLLCLATAELWAFDRHYQSWWSVRPPAGESFDTRLGWRNTALYAPLPSRAFPPQNHAVYGIAIEEAGLRLMLFRPLTPRSTSPIMGELPLRWPPPATSSTHADAVAWSRKAMSTRLALKLGGFAFLKEPCIGDGPSDYAVEWTGTSYEVWVSYPLLILATGLPPALGCVRWAAALRRRRRAAGRSVCAACSYDLTGNVSGVCPECGTKISS